MLILAQYYALSIQVKVVQWKVNHDAIKIVTSGLELKLKEFIQNQHKGLKCIPM